MDAVMRDVNAHRTAEDLAGTTDSDLDGRLREIIACAADIVVDDLVA